MTLQILILSPILEMPTLFVYGCWEKHKSTNSDRNPFNLT